MSSNALADVLPTVDRIVELHSDGMTMYGGAEVFSVNRDCIDSARGSSINAVLYSCDEAEPDPLQLAIHLFAHLNKGHCFTDGVKRAAWMTLMDAMLMNGLNILATQQEATDFVLSHAAGEGLQLEVVAAWLVPRLAAA